MKSEIRNIAAAVFCAFVLTASQALAQDQEAAQPSGTLVAMAPSVSSPVVDEQAVRMNDLVVTEDITTSQTASPAQAKSADDVVRELYDSFMAEAGLHEGANGDLHFYFATRQVDQATASPDFGKSRVLAFELAYHDALKQFVKSTSETIKTEAVRDFFADTSTNAATFEEQMSQGKSTLGALVDKAVALGDAVLSSKLEDYEVDPEQFKAAPPDQKKDLLSDAFSKKIVEQTSKRLGGVVPIQNFIGDNGKGRQSVGVLIMYSPKLEAIAQSLSREQKPKVAKQGPPLNQVIPLNDPTKLYDLLGVRVLFDENGPVVVSYGQWSNSYNGSNENMQQRYRNIAFDQASTLAAAQLSEFLNTSFTSVEKSEIGEVAKLAKVRRGDSGDVEEISANDIIDIRSEQSKRKSNANLKGAGTIKRWVYTTPEGHEIVGVIRSYSFAGIEGAKKTFKKPQTSAHKASGGQSQPSGRKSVNQMDVKDF